MVAGRPWRGWGDQKEQWLCFYHTKRGSTWYIVCEVRSVRERDRKWWKWCHHRRAEIGDEFTLSPTQSKHFSFHQSTLKWLSLRSWPQIKSHSLLVLSQVVTIVAPKLPISSHIPLPKKSHSSLRLSHTVRQVIEPKTNDRMYGCRVLPIENNESN